MTAFAANSVLCRMALAPASIDPASFTSLRMLSGAVTLWLLARIVGGRSAAGGGSWESAAYLFVYAITFSFAYLSLSAGTGALLLFGSVQITMILWALARGERPRPGRWIGMAIAVGGFVYLVLPGVTAPSPLGAALMTTAGVAWGFYSLRRTPRSRRWAAYCSSVSRSEHASRSPRCSSSAGSLSRSSRGPRRIPEDTADRPVPLPQAVIITLRPVPVQVCGYGHVATSRGDVCHGYTQVCR